MRLTQATKLLRLPVEIERLNILGTAAAQNGHALTSRSADVDVHGHFEDETARGEVARELRHRLRIGGGAGRADRDNHRNFLRTAKRFVVFRAIHSVQAGAFSDDLLSHLVIDSQPGGWNEEELEDISRCGVDVYPSAGYRRKQIHQTHGVDRFLKMALPRRIRSAS